MELTPPGPQERLDALRPRQFADAGQCAQAILQQVGRRVVLALPLGLGKANHIANALFERAMQDASLELTILTGLTPEKPRNLPALQQRFVDPIVERLFGDYPDLAYARALREGKLPSNIAVTEFFLRPGGWLDVPPAQRAYTSLNYTDVGREVLRRGVNVLAQLVARRGEGDASRYSLSCNPDVTLEILPTLTARRARSDGVAIVGQVNQLLPFMPGGAEVPPETFDCLLQGPEYEFRLFAPLRQYVSLADYAAGLHVASLVKDGGTLQIGIGSIGDAIAYALILRHQQPAVFRAALAALVAPAALDERERELAPFSEGLYGNSEMLVDGFIDLYRAGILRRRVATDCGSLEQGTVTAGSAGGGPVMHAAFFFGSGALYEALRDLDDDQIADIAMTAVSYTNSLLGDEALKRDQRRHARYINNAMIATLLGEIASDTLAEGRVVSGVGGQHDFVTQAHALDNARAILVLASTHENDGKLASSIRWSHPHVTLPRHLRDIVVTEYGIADLRGRTDRDCIAAMLAIADTRFQSRLADAAKRTRKIEPDFTVPAKASRNQPEYLEQAFAQFRAEGLFPEYPFGTDLTTIEQRLVRGLRRVKKWSGTKPSLAMRAMLGLLAGRPNDAEHEALARIELAQPRSARDRLYSALVLRALRERRDA
jgi:acyl-CoA hydrolase